MFFIGVDSHKGHLAACAVDEVGRVTDERTFANDQQGHRAMLLWVSGMQQLRRIGIEGSSNHGSGLARLLLEMGEDVREVPPILTHRQRARTGRAGKCDPADAQAIAMVVAREGGLAPAAAGSSNADLKVLVDCRDQLIGERTRTKNRLHADLSILCPGYKATARSFASHVRRRRARALLEQATGVRSELALERLQRIEELDRQIVACEARIEHAVGESGTSLTRIPGVGIITAAKLLGETGDPRRFRSAAAFAAMCGAAPIPASSGYTQRHRLNRGGNRQLNRALHTIALVQTRVDERARGYVDRKRQEGKSPREAMRCLSRHLANVVAPRQDS